MTERSIAFHRMIWCGTTTDSIAAYLGITVVYEQIAESDPDKIGFASDGVRPLCVWRYGTAIEGDRYQISNNHGHINGWTTRTKIYGIVTEIFD